MATSNSSNNNNRVVFEDFFPSMVEKLGEERFMDELCKGFGLLKDEKKGVITFDSLKKNSAILGMGEMNEEESREMLREGDVDGDGCLNQMEFCVLMFRLSPGLMEDSRRWLQHALGNRL